MSKKSIRENFRNEVFNRDKFKCVFCDITTNLDAPHITDRHLIVNGGYVKENGITLCSEHHDLVEDWNRYGEVTDEKYHPNSLYKMINSSKELAFINATRLAPLKYASISNNKYIICSKNSEGVYLLVDNTATYYALSDIVIGD